MHRNVRNIEQKKSKIFMSFLLAHKNVEISEMK